MSASDLGLRFTPLRPAHSTLSTLTLTSGLNSYKASGKSSARLPGATIYNTERERDDQIQGA